MFCQSKTGTWHVEDTTYESVSLTRCGLALIGATRAPLLPEDNEPRRRACLICPWPGGTHPHWERRNLDGSIRLQSNVAQVNEAVSK